MATQAAVSDYLTQLQSNESQYKSRAVAADTKFRSAQPKSQQPKSKPITPPKPVSLLTKIGKTAKSVGNSAVSGERTFATGIARDLPGGTNDLEANLKASEQANKNIQVARTIKNPTQSEKLIKANTAAGSTAAKNTTATIKAMPTTGQVGAGAASTAADILTAGTLPELKGASLLAKTGRVATQASAFGTAGALNSAASGGNKKQIAENFATGAALPGVLHVAGKGVSKAIKGVVGDNSTKITAARSLLDASRSNPTSANLDINTTKSINSIMDKLHTPKSVIEAGKAQDEAAIAAQDQAEKTAKETQKNVEQSKKLDNQIELVNAKKADGKFTNVDKVKIQQLKSQKADLGLPETAPSDNPLTQAIDKNFKGGTNGSEESKALAYVRANPEKTLGTYNDLVKQKFGASNVVSGDEAKYAIPGFNSTKSVAYHEPASALAKVKYQQLLDDSTTKHKPVLLMAGGSGAGKTSALKRLGINYDNYAAVVDTNSNKLESTEQKIKQALDSGRHIEVFYVHRDPVKSFKSVIERGKEEGRLVPVDTHIDTHYGSHSVVNDLAKKYEDNPKVEFTVASNNHGHGKARPISLDEVPKMRYTKEDIKPILQKEADNAHAEGKISTEEHAVYSGKDTLGASRPDVQTVESGTGKTTGSQPESQRTARPEKVEAAPKPQKISQSAKRSEYKPGKPEPVNVPYPEKPKPATPDIKTSKLADRTETIAIKKDLVSGFADKPEYAKVNMRQQAEAAANLLKSDPERLQRIAMGQERPPEGLLPESAWVAAVHNAKKTGDAQALIDLGTHSHLVSEATGMGQRIRALGELDNDSPATHIKKIADIGNKKFEKKTGKTFDKVVKDNVKEVKKAITPVKVRDWNSLVESLRC